MNLSLTLPKRSLAPREGHRPAGRRSTLRLACGVAAAVVAGCGEEESPFTAEDAKLGERLFQTYCASCHGIEGGGREGGGPPLRGSSWVAGPQGRMVRIVLHGLRGAIEVGGETYDREMPGFGPMLSDRELATLVSYVRWRWSPREGTVSAAEVRRIRAATADRTRYWTAPELLERVGGRE